jgi:hypothetical protein
MSRHVMLSLQTSLMEMFLILKSMIRLERHNNEVCVKGSNSNKSFYSNVVGMILSIEKSK